MAEYKKGQRLHIEFDAVVNRLYPDGDVDVLVANGKAYFSKEHLDAIATPIVEEPTGKWAVVQDKDGVAWCRRYAESATLGRWLQGGTLRMADWSDIEGPTVLFEGVSG